MDAVAEIDPYKSLRVGVDMRSPDLVKDSNPLGPGEKHNAAEVVIYQYDGPSGLSKTGLEVGEIIINMLRDHELVSVEDPFQASDLSALRLFREVGLSFYPMQ